MKVTLYADPASHPCIAVALMLAHKGIEYETVWLLMPFGRLTLRLLSLPTGIPGVCDPATAESSQ